MITNNFRIKDINYKNCVLLFFLFKNMNENLEKIVELVKVRKKVIANSWLSEVPQIYYIGMPKTASQSLIYGFPGVSVSQWHNVKFFEKYI